MKIFERIFGKSMNNKEDNRKIPDYIEKSLSIYNGNPYYMDNCESIFVSTQLGIEVIKKIKQIILIEFESYHQDHTVENEVYQGFLKKIDETVEKTLVFGSCVLKPVIRGKKIIIETIYPTNFNWISEDNILFFTKKEYEKESYRYEENQYFEDGILVITRKLFKGFFGRGTELPLTTIPELSTLPPESRIPTEEFLFAYYTTSLTNNKDINSLLGLPILANAFDVLKLIDSEFSRLERESIKSETRLFASESVISGIKEENSQFFIRSDTIEDKNGAMVYEHGKKDIEHSNLLVLNEKIKRLENIVGLSRGSISNAEQISSKTATEIINSSQVTLRTKESEAKQLEKALKVLFTVLVKLNTGNFNIPLVDDLVVYFDDSLIKNKFEDLESMRRDVIDNLIPAREYLKEKYGIDDETANAWTKEISSLMSEEYIK